MAVDAESRKASLEFPRQSKLEGISHDLPVRRQTICDYRFWPDSHFVCFTGLVCEWEERLPLHLLRHDYELRLRHGSALLPRSRPCGYPHLHVPRDRAPCV